MFIVIIGTRCAGKATVQDYLVQHKDFRPVKIVDYKSDEVDKVGATDYPNVVQELSEKESTSVNRGTADLELSDISANTHRMSFLTMTSPISSCLPSPAPGDTLIQPLLFRSSVDLLAHVTKNWRTNFVTIDLVSQHVLAEFKIRPFVLVVSVDAPLLIRYRRCLDWSDSEYSLEEFIKQHDSFYYSHRAGGLDTPSHSRSAFVMASAETSFQSTSQMANIHVVNAFDSVSGLHDHLDDINLLDPERLRPGWDTYFMQLASLASLRSNCMKRRVGAILVRNKRVVSTGYNGTPRGVKNCNEGGCLRCNTASETPDECLCLHAEENALLEAGRERVGDGAVLYCNTCPCLKCTIKIIQTGVREVVYNLSYKVDDASAALFAEADVILRRYAMPT